MKSEKQYWKSFNQLDQNRDYLDFLEKEFPENAWKLGNTVSRRHFLSIMGASLALAGLAGCRRPVEKILPYTKAPEDVVPGVPLYYATSMPAGHQTYGLLVKTHEGRPVKIEGNPRHPSTSGATDPLLQAEILNLYDPDRSKRIIYKKVESNWDQFVVFWQERYTRFLKNGGEGLVIVSEPYSSPTIHRLRQQLEHSMPKARWICYEPFGPESVLLGIQKLTQQTLMPVYHLEQAQVVLSLDDNFLQTHPQRIRMARAFANNRRVRSPQDTMNRLYVVENAMTLTGGMADHRLRLPSKDIPKLVAALVDELNHLGTTLPTLNVKPELTSLEHKWINALASDLIKHRGQSLVLCGFHHPPQIQALVLAINNALSNWGRTITFRTPREAGLSSTGDLLALKRSAETYSIDTLVMLGGNPLYNTPADLDFKSILDSALHSIHVSSHVDETSSACEWHIPKSHFLEAWGDAKSVDGTPSVIQPMIAPLFDSYSITKILGLLATGRNQRDYAIVRDTWKQRFGQYRFEQVLHDGYAETTTASKTPKAYSNQLKQYLKDYEHYISAGETDYTVTILPSPLMMDGTYSNNGWLQECPDTITKLAWGNAALVSPKTAKNLGIVNEQEIRITTDCGSAVMPLWIVPGQADNTIIMHAGYGRRGIGRIANDTGIDVYPLRSLRAQWMSIPAEIDVLKSRRPLANTQDHASLEGRPLYREAKLDEYRHHPRFVQETVEHPPLKNLWKDPEAYEQGYQWSMVIDLNACIGCNACTLACQSENNIPIVGHEQIRKGREMHWIRIDRYFEGDVGDPQVCYQPVPCMHCENAPCEQVCPVAATVHDKEGLNVMTYNRCVGTRYCSNNCPYKVRRFNFFSYTHELPDLVKMVQNPDVTVRSRGVMEKCTFCIQRIKAVKQKAKQERRQIHDGELQTACQQACPTQAIVFGNKNDSDSQVSHDRENERRYDMLAEYNTLPRTSYLAKLRNPNPELS